MGKQTIVGKKYGPSDNSFSQCLSNKRYMQHKHKYYCLAGTNENPPKKAQIVEIQTEPFLMKPDDAKAEYYFIIVKDSEGRSHSILYWEQYVIKE